MIMILTWHDKKLAIKVTLLVIAGDFQRTRDPDEYQWSHIQAKRRIN